MNMLQTSPPAADEPGTDFVVDLQCNKRTIHDKDCYLPLPCNQHTLYQLHNPGQSLARHSRTTKQALCVRINRIRQDLINTEMATKALCATRPTPLFADISLHQPRPSRELMSASIPRTKTNTHVIHVTERTCKVEKPTEQKTRWHATDSEACVLRCIQTMYHH